ncbi:hypothetical protein ECG_09682 [Echinococcus granulosus]|nr:hypothetical protein ECG_09682 [Echinococcus granulosus]
MVLPPPLCPSTGSGSSRGTLRNRDRLDARGSLHRRDASRMSAMDRSPELDWTGNGPLMWILWAVMHYAYVRQIFCLEAWGVDGTQQQRHECRGDIRQYPRGGMDTEAGSAGYKSEQ